MAFLLEEHRPAPVDPKPGMLSIGEPFPRSTGRRGGTGDTLKPGQHIRRGPQGEPRLLSFDEAGETHAITPMAKAMEYAERAEYMYIAPGQATVSALLALFWLKVAELEGRGLLPADATEPSSEDALPDK
jgi:hypothetical protein